ncbi:hypothetical protein AB0I28_08060 [Phytomonospora sp. NPDC050363]|uniref:hypothetical protein n=1 Tax=Phytomonospora sp. NPDC050363 TaxID=3155642 RepID=UPI0033FFC1D9
MTALTVRRIAAKAAIAGVGLLAVAGLSACRVETGAALFVQDERVTEQQVDDIVESAPEIGPDGPIELATARRNVVTWLATSELAERVSAETGTALPTPDYAGEAALLKVDGDNEYARLQAQHKAYLPVLVSGAAPAELTDEMSAEILAPVTEATGKPTSDYQPGLAQVFTEPAAQAALGQRQALADLVAEYDVLANPRYGDLGIGLGVMTLVDPSTQQQFQLALVAPIPTTTS